MPKVRARIVIVAYQSGDHLQTCLDRVAAQSAIDFEVVIVNNKCPDDCTATVQLPDHRFRILEAPDNLGFAGGSNLGAAGAQTDWIITLNPDAWPQPNWLESLLEASRTYPDAAMLGSTLLQSENPDIVDGFGDAYSIFGIAWRGGHNGAITDLPDTDMQVFGPCGAAAAYRRDMFETLGGFDPTFFCYLEDVDLSIRIQRSGAYCVQVRAAEVLHYGSGSTGKQSDFQYFQSYRNNLRMIVKTSPRLLLPLQLLAYGLSQSYILYRNRHNKGARARRDGIKAGIRRIPQAFKDRGETQRGFRQGSFSFARKIAWRPVHIKKLSIHCWPIRRTR
jgi:GT2 family glycosyltransferase